MDMKKNLVIFILIRSINNFKKEDKVFGEDELKKTKKNLNALKLFY